MGRIGSVLDRQLGRIVSVHEAGRWPSGEPFYAMRLVAGQPFDRVSARRINSRRTRSVLRARHLVEREEAVPPPTCGEEPRSWRGRGPRLLPQAHEPVGLALIGPFQPSNHGALENGSTQSRYSFSPRSAAWCRALQST
jgi:hypothetical protein